MKKFISRPQFKNYISYDDQGSIGLLVKRKQKVLIDSHVAIAHSILSCSKLVLAQNLYSLYLEKMTKHSIKLEVAYSDTDSAAIIHYVKGQTLDNYYSALRDLAKNMDFSNWPDLHPLFSGAPDSKERAQLLEIKEQNKSRLGIFKDELNMKVIKSAYFACPKTYFIQFHNQEKDKITTKGCRKSRLDINMDRIERFLLGKNKEIELSYKHVEFSIKKHDNIFRQTKRKICDRLYTKRWLANDGIVTLAYGNPDIDCYLCVYEIINKIVDEAEKVEKIVPLCTM